MTRTERARRGNYLVGLLLVAVIANFFLGASLIYTRSQVSDRDTCVADWQQQFAESYLPRSRAAEQVGKAEDDVLVAVSEENPVDFKKAVIRYLEVREQQDKDRAKNPLPEFPNELCGQPTERDR